MSAKQTLFLDPSIVHIYEELSLDDGPKQALNADRGTMPVDARRMIQNYIEEGHTQGALEIFSSSIASGRCPTPKMINMLVNIIIDDDSLNLTITKRMSLCIKVVELLAFILDTHGPKCFQHLWTTFGNSKQPKDAEKSADDLVGQTECYLSQYDGFFIFVKSVLQTNADELSRERSQQHGLLLGFLISILELDIRLRKESYVDMQQAVIVQLLERDAFKVNLVNELDSIFSCYETSVDPTEALRDDLQHSNHPEFQYSSRLMNLFIICAYTEGLLKTKNFEEDAYRHFARLRGQQCSYFLESISNPTFVTTLCSLAFSDSDLSLVPDDALQYKHNKTQVLNKIFKFDMLTRPISIDNIEDIWRHVIIMAKRVSCYLESKVVRYDFQSAKKLCTYVTSGLTEDEMSLIWVNAPGAVEGWRAHITVMLNEVGQRAYKGYSAQHIRELRESVELTMDMTQMSLEVV